MEEGASFNFENIFAADFHFFTNCEAAKR